MIDIFIVEYKIGREQNIGIVMKTIKLAKE